MSNHQSSSGHGQNDSGSFRGTPPTAAGGNDPGSGYTGAPTSYIWVYPNGVDPNSDSYTPGVGSCSSGCPEPQPPRNFDFQEHLGADNHCPTNASENHNPPARSLNAYLHPDRQRQARELEDKIDSLFPDMGQRQ